MIGITDVRLITSRDATALVVAEHYLHRRPPISYAYGAFVGTELMGAVTFGVPASRHLQMSACPSVPGNVIELNRLWLHDDLGHNHESWFVTRALKLLPPPNSCQLRRSRSRPYGVHLPGIELSLRRVDRYGA